MIRKIRNNNNASVWGVIIFIVCLAAAGITILIVGEVLEPFLNFMAGSDPNIDSEVSAPRGWVTQFFEIIWPRGLLLGIFFGLSFALIMHYQKKEYVEVG